MFPSKLGTAKVLVFSFTVPSLCTQISISICVHNAFTPYAWVYVFFFSILIMKFLLSQYMLSISSFLMAAY